MEESALSRPAQLKGPWCCLSSLMGGQPGPAGHSGVELVGRRAHQNVGQFKTWELLISEYSVWYFLMAREESGPQGWSGAAVCVCVGRNGSWPHVTQSGLEKAAPFSGVCSRLTPRWRDEGGRSGRGAGWGGVLAAGWHAGGGAVSRACSPWWRALGLGRRGGSSRSVSSSK